MRKNSFKKYLWLFFFLGLQWPAYAQDKKPLLSGAKLYMNYCVGCHALKYVRYNRLASDLGLDEQSLLKENLLSNKSQWNDFVRVALTPKEATLWFGAPPPDLSLMAKEKGLVWLRNYLTGFYPDAHRPFGTNNSVVPEVAMPDILPRSLQEEELHSLLAFLAYVAEPDKDMRQSFALFIFPLLCILFVLLWRLKRLYWQSIH